MDIKTYLNSKSINYREVSGEIITKCLFNNCDKDSGSGEAHLYFNQEGLYECKKCGEKGNLITLKKHFGDISPTQQTSSYKRARFDDGLVEKCHANLPEHIRAYLNGRGITDEIINKFKLGYGTFFGKRFITIPIPDEVGYAFFKLRQDPEDGDDKMTYPKGEACLYGLFGAGKQIVCEGELDALALISQGKNAVTSTHGANTFKEHWVDERFKQCESIYVCFDNDNAGKEGAEKALKAINKQGIRNTYKITLPDEIGEKGDITDYLTKLKYPVEDLYEKYASKYPEQIDASQFSELASDDVANILNLTIKNDYTNKIITLLCQLTAYTEDAQFNIAFNSPSSTGKSYIALEVSRLFPNEDVIKLGNCSKTAFFHEQGIYDKETNEITIDLSRKILIFTDMPHTGLLEGLRSFLSHDEKIMKSKITDKNQSGGNRTKTVALKGYPSVIFCTAGLKMDQQEQTRFILLSPEINDEKILAGINNTIRKESDNESYVQWLENDPARKLFKLRILAIKQENISDIKIAHQEQIIERFLKQSKKLQPKHQRDIKRLLSIIKAFALLNLWWRNRVGNTLEANDSDIEQAFNLWEKTSVSQEFNLPPFVYDLFLDVILPFYMSKNPNIDFNNISALEERLKVGVTRGEIINQHYKVYGRTLDVHQLRQQIIPILETSGLIYQEPDALDRRKMLVFPTFIQDTTENNSEDGGGVNIDVEN